MARKWQILLHLAAILAENGPVRLQQNAAGPSQASALSTEAKNMTAKQVTHCLAISSLQLINNSNISILTCETSKLLAWTALQQRAESLAASDCTTTTAIVIE